MKIINNGLKQWSPAYQFRQCYIIEHKGKRIEYMPPNTWGFRDTWRAAMRDCLIRTLKGYKHNEVWA